MKQFIFWLVLLMIPISGHCLIITMEGSGKVTAGPEQNFTGKVTVESIFKGEPPSKNSISLMTFSPGARTAWHSHFFGEILIVKKGVGRVQAWNEPIKEIRAGDIIWTPPGQKHWHGAGSELEMSHYSIVESIDGKEVEWMGKVSDEQYGSF